MQYTKKLPREGRFAAVWETADGEICTTVYEWDEDDLVDCDTGEDVHPPFLRESRNHRNLTFITSLEPPWEPKIGDFLEFSDDPEFSKSECAWGPLVGIHKDNPRFPYRLQAGGKFAYCRKPQHITLAKGE